MGRLTAITVLFILGLIGESALASIEIPLTWKSVHIQTTDRGGAEFRATVDDEGNLDSLDVIVRGSALLVPQNCLEGLVRPYLNGLDLSYGQFETGQSYWSIEIPFDSTGSDELESTFNLVFSQEVLLWSYKSIQVDISTWEDVDVCPLAIGNSE